ncbi:unnamed protein product (macronuclear) [Paramecium tetraurelia]|uniref:Nuclear pore protein n=1 Tax=Paramecium tetraurelia TaxID=5888 RepID=A0DR18_PARTE|nr:uncharacterized protein GSPATT00002886001 [Paramecium tetraurelia]CAK85485.1 unnamed protein product [Paramecium tetraurelia]|eukprot:XP_001452882.1 hypothetical protein (macronuclear) [Paramecium tetraurelia strain d4-2]
MQINSNGLNAGIGGTQNGNMPTSQVLKQIAQNKQQTQQNKQAQEQDLAIIAQQTDHLRKRISNIFNMPIKLKKTQNFMIEDIGLKVDSLFKKSHLNQSNVDYLSDHIKRLGDRINQEMKKKQEQYHSSIQIDNFRNFSSIQQEFQKNKQIYNSFYKTELKTTARQKEKLIDILTSSNRTEKLVSHEIQLNQYSEVILSKLFTENHLYQALLNFIKNKNDLSIYEKLFRTLELFETTHNVEMRLLADQFKNISNTLNQQQKCERIIRNTVTHLENDMLKQIGHLDLQNLNRKFKEFYLPYLQTTELYQIGQFFPTGILFILMRCGKINEAQKILSGLISSDQRIAQQFLSFFDLQKQEILNQNDVEEKSRQQYCDILLQQCYWLLLDVSDAYDVFEQTQFQKDRDFYIWFTLKTTHCSDEFVVYERSDQESKKAFFHWKLIDLHENIPQSTVSLRINIILQRYDYILSELYKYQNQCLSQVEYFILDTVLTALKMKIQKNATAEEQKKNIIDNLVNYTQNKLPLVSCLLMSVSTYNVEAIANLLQKTNHVTQVLMDKNFRENLEVIFGKEGLLNITNEMVHLFFEKSLHNSLKEFQQQLEKSSTMNQINDCHTVLILKLDEMSIYLKQILNQYTETLLETAIYLYHETQLVYILSCVIVNQYCVIKLGSQIEKRQLQVRNLETLHSRIKSCAKDCRQFTYFYRFYLIEIFQQTQQSMRQEQVNLNEINQALSNLNIKELTKNLIENKQVHLIKMVFWQILQLIDLKKCQQKSYLIEKIQELNEALLKFPESQGIKICREDVQFSQIVVDILNSYSKVLKMY